MPRTRLLPILCLVAALLAGCQATDHRYPFGRPETFILWPPPPAEPQIRYLGSLAGSADVGSDGSWWEAIVGRKAFPLVKPYGLSVDAEGTVYVADRGAHCVHLLNPSRHEYRRIERVGGTAFDTPVGVAAAEPGRLYVTDPGLQEVFALDREGNLLFRLGDGWEFDRPSGIAVDPRTREVYICDARKDCVVVMNEQGKYLRHFGGRGSEKGGLNFPTNLCLGRDGLVYVSDSMNFRVQIFKPDGTFVDTFGTQGDASGYFCRLTGIAGDSQGHLFTVDTLFETVQIFDRQGRFLLAFGETGKGPGQFNLPSGIFIDPRNRIYVADTHNSRVQVFEFLGDPQALKGKP